MESFSLIRLLKAYMYEPYPLLREFSSVNRHYFLGVERKYTQLMHINPRSHFAYVLFFSTVSSVSCILLFFQSIRFGLFLSPSLQKVSEIYWGKKTLKNLHLTAKGESEYVPLDVVASNSRL